MTDLERAIRHIKTRADAWAVKEIEKALSQEPCDDTISRKEFLKAIDTWDKFGVDDTNSLFRLDNLSLPHYVPYIHYDDVIKCIKGMPSVTQKSGKWISVSERLPEEYERVLVTIQIPNRTAKARSSTYYNHHFANDNGDFWNDTDMEVIAWMPLPEPYKAEREEQTE